MVALTFGLMSAAAKRRARVGWAQAEARVPKGLPQNVAVGLVTQGTMPIMAKMIQKQVRALGRQAFPLPL